MRIQDRTFSIALSVMFLAIAVIMFFYVRLDVRQEQTRILRAMEGDIRDLLINHVQEKEEVPNLQYDHILGFGIYDASGSSVITRLDAPESIIPIEAEYTNWNYRENYFEHFEQTDILAESTHLTDDPRYSEFLQISDLDESNIIYMKMELPPGVPGRRIIRMVLPVIGLLLLGVGLALLLHYYYRYRKIEEELRSKEYLIVLGTAARTLTHEMKNPLSAIRLQTSLLRRDPANRKSMELDIVEEEVERLSILMDQTRFFLTDPEGDARLIDLAKFLDDLRPRWNTGMAWLPADSPTFIRADRDRLRSVVENLLSNAHESGSETRHIALELISGEEGAVLSVSDRGTGIPDEIAGRVSEPFFTTKPRGTGLGLYLVRQFSEAAGGTMKIRTGAETGTTVSVIFPEASE